VSEWQWVVERIVTWGEDEVSRSRRLCIRLPEWLQVSRPFFIVEAPSSPYRENGARVTVRWEATRRARRLRWGFAPPSLRTLAAVAVTLVLHASLTLFKPLLHGDDFEAIDRDLLILCPRVLVTAVECGGEAPYCETVRRKRISVEVDYCHYGLRRGGADPCEPPNVSLLGGLLPRHPACNPMPLVHEVVRGETLSSIARAYRIRDWRVIYRHPDNQWLFEDRPNPNRIFPGDRIVIPVPPDEIDCEV
jgi:hypothetical protein